MTGQNHKLTTTTSGSTTITNVGNTFNSRSYFAEADYEFGSRFVPYLRYDAFHSDEYKTGSVYAGNPLKDIGQTTVGFAYMLNYNVRLNLDYTNNEPTSAPGSINTSTTRAQFWFLW
jgi:hypothetical protein